MGSIQKLKGMKHKRSNGFTPPEFFKNFSGAGKNNRKTPTGFTLIEVLVVIFIISVISGSVLASSWRGQSQYSVAKAAQKLAADLRRVQGMALAGKLQGASAPAGYGLYMQSSGQYLIFYNNGASKIYDGASVILETVDMDRVSLSPSGGSVFFVPPDPTTYINGANAGSQAFTITGGSYAKNVTVFVGGRIDID